MKIKVRKILATFKTNDNLYSKPIHYWYYEKTNVIYDYELNYPVGKIAIDESGSPIKIDNDTYLIDKIISIPEFKIYY